MSTLSPAMFEQYLRGSRAAPLADAAAGASVVSVASVAVADAVPAKKPRGFAALKARGDLDRLRAIASSGGVACHKQGRANRWTSEQARAAGHRSVQAAHNRAATHPRQPRYAVS